ncbi:MAG: DNA-binding response regulator [Candidatus Contendobacter odensis]|uniref:DNA-binding response regulator n=1 Tax=Candidatus Contendibacter odensensis TaxID=1400860 RepID=A0A2G6PG03_9GAMM|nr:MAG: DNA-binding response regulator [Candidatus Contendobacter odensis]
MHILIVDDEPLARDRLRTLLDRLADYQVCGEASDGLEALRLTQILHPDIVLLDIEMPGLDGLEIARRLATFEQPPAIVFTTAHSKYALNAFGAQAIAYLLKPVRLEKLEQALADAHRLNRAQLAHLAAEPEKTKEQQRSYMRVQVGQRLDLIPLADVFYFRANQKYVVVRHRHGEALIEQSLRSLEQELGARVIRVHRNALAIVVQVAGLKKKPDGSTVVIFQDIVDELEVSRRHLPVIRQFLKES